MPNTRGWQVALLLLASTILCVSHAKSPRSARHSEHQNDLEGAHRRAEEFTARLLDAFSSGNTIFDPCVAPENDAKVYESISEVSFMKPSFFERCVQSFEVDTNNMLDHINGLYVIFSQYHCFFDIAKDPSASDPLIYQPELGYSVYGEGSGKVDLQAGFQTIFKKVQANGASQATFWDISSLVNRLRDAHITLQTWSLYPFAEMTLIPARFTSIDNGSDAKMQPTYSLDSNGKIQLKLRFIYTGVDEEASVTTINGESVHDFITNLANNPALSLGYQSLGARINALIGQSTPFDFPLGYLQVTGRPSDVLPDTLEITYKGGATETFYTAVALLDSSNIFDFVDLTTLPSYFYVDRTLFESLSNQPGSLRENFDVALGNIQNASFIPTDTPRPTVYTALHHQSSGVRRKLQSFVFDETFKSDLEADTDVAAYSIENEYAVLKFQSFTLSIDKTADIYKQVASAAKERGVTKLIVDISGNGGGLAMAGVALAQLMYPTVNSSWFQDRWNIRYNDIMDAFTTFCVPLLTDILTLLNTVDVSYFQDAVDNLSEEMIMAANITVNNMYLLCPSNGTACQVLLPALESAMATFVESRAAPDVMQLLRVLLFTLITINPWTVGLPETWLDNLHALVDFAGNTTEVVVDYGGVNSSFTTRFDIGIAGSTDSLEYIADLVANTTAALDFFSFDEFVIVSDGVAASATSIFASSVEQIWKNRDRSGVSQPLTTVAYGGSGNLGDIAISAIPASIRDVNLDYPLVADAALYVWEILVQGNKKYAGLVQDARVAYESALYLPPYFASAVPTLPVVTYFDTFMGFESLPMQYIYMPPDKYIGKIYTGVTLDDGADLKSLYAEASAFFASGPVAGAKVLNVLNDLQFSPTKGNNRSSPSENGSSASGNSASVRVFPSLVLIVSGIVSSVLFILM